MDLFERHIHYFETEDEYEDARQNEYEEPWASFIDETDTVNYNKSGDELLEEMPLTFEIVSNGSIRWTASDTGNTIALQYKKNDGEWTLITANTGDTAPNISVSAGDIVQFRAPISISGYESMTDGGNPFRTNTFKGTSCNFNVRGNIMSLLDGNNFATLKSFPNQRLRVFYALFVECTGLIDAESLILPATSLTQSTYQYMFDGCTGLIKAPKLPCTTLYAGCYYGMFRNCSSLTQAPELPATTLVGDCYCSMFRGCTSLAKAPKLPASAVTMNCYSYMFMNCNGLTDESSLILPAMTMDRYSYQGMFTGCANLVRGPELPATTLAASCYANMFANCRSLTTAPQLPATTLAGSCYGWMFENCTSLVQAPVLVAETLLDQSYRRMFNGCTKLNYIKCLALTIASNSCETWVGSVASSGTFIKSGSKNDWPTGVSGIPNNWTVQNAT